MKISDYAFISDCRSAALVSRDGSIDWYCLPRFSSPSVFGRLLDPKAGHWSIGPTEHFEASRSYISDTLVLETKYVTSAGTVVVTDCLALGQGPESQIGGRAPHVLIRSVRGLDGSVPMQMEYFPRMEYGLTVPRYFDREGVLATDGGPVMLRLTTPLELARREYAASASFVIEAGERRDFYMVYTPKFPPWDEDQSGTVPDRSYSVDATVDMWRRWVKKRQSYEGLYPDLAIRSSLVLQGLTYAPSGAVVAAATTSLPEENGADTNWDYRFAWLRDASMIMRALWLTMRTDEEPRRFFDWACDAGGVMKSREEVQIMYGLEGERDLSEHVLAHMAGFNGSAPVRVGNEAWTQTQLDVLGEVLNAAFRLRRRLDLANDQRLRETLVSFADLAATHWEKPDSGIWESRGRERHYLFSKVMCWVALDRAVKLASQLKAGRKKDGWARKRDEIHRAVLTEGWNEKKRFFAGVLGTDELDVVALMLPLVGFLPAEDPRMLSTIDAVLGGLCDGGLVRRRPDEKNAFIVCSYWLVECLAMKGDLDLAAERFEKVNSLANDLGLLSEQADLASGELWGNFPQAFSHGGQINAAWRLTLAERGQSESLELD